MGAHWLLDAMVDGELLKSIWSGGAVLPCLFGVESSATHFLVQVAFNDEREQGSSPAFRQDLARISSPQARGVLYRETITNLSYHCDSPSQLMNELANGCTKIVIHFFYQLLSWKSIARLDTSKCLRCSSEHYSRSPTSSQAVL